MLIVGSHRINTSEFKHVKYLSNKRVLQVVCGQQHTICRATDINMDPNRNIKMSSDGISEDLHFFISQFSNNSVCDYT